MFYRSVAFLESYNWPKQKHNTDSVLKGTFRGDFSKRQSNIMRFILFFSRQNNDGAAYIPEYRYFELCGVSRTKIKTELILLEEMNVIIWDRDKMLFQINYNSSFWKVKSNKFFDEDLYHELVELNENIQ